MVKLAIKAVLDSAAINGSIRWGNNADSLKQDKDTFDGSDSEQLLEQILELVIHQNEY